MLSPVSIHDSTKIPGIDTLAVVVRLGKLERHLTALGLRAEAAVIRRLRADLGQHNRRCAA